MFSSKPAVPHQPPTDVSTIAPATTTIVAQAEFPTGQSTTTSIDYDPKQTPTTVTSAPQPIAPMAGASPHADSAFQAPASASTLPPPRTAPTVYITSTTATAEPAAFPLITLGPIIGLVTDSTARLLIECNTTMTVKVRLTLIARNCRATPKVAPFDHKHNIGAIAIHPTLARPLNTQPNTQLSTQHDAILSGASSGSPVNGAPASHIPPPMNTQAGAIMTGASSGSPVNGASATALSSPPTPSPNQRSAGSPGTTVGHYSAADLIGSVSSEARPAPATGPSPAEHAQHVHRGGETQPAKDADTFAPSTIADEVRDGADEVRGGDVFDKDVDCTAHRVSTVTFVGLEADARYEVTFGNVKGRVTSTVTTLLKDWAVTPSTPMNVAFVSCNMVAVTKDLELPDSDLWLDLRRRVAAHEIDYVLHIGDQIYADEKRDLKEDKVRDYQLVFKTGVEMIADLPTSDWPACAVHIKELYRQLYRETWSHPPTAFVLANAPSLMIYDDHDFRDDFGCDPADSDPNSKEFYVGRCAQAVMCEYQRQLWDNVDFTAIDKIKSDFHTALSPQRTLHVALLSSYPIVLCTL